MKVEIWFDFTCPFSFRGIKNFNAALDLFANKKDVRVFFKSYNIAPDVKKTVNIDAYQFLANQKDITYDEAKSVYDRIYEIAKEEGLIFNFQDVISTTSCKAHNILKSIEDKCAIKTFICYVFNAHFIEGKDISSLEVLTEIGENVSLLKEDIKAVYDTEMYTPDVDNDFLIAENYGLTGVPAFVIDDSYYLMGAHSKEAYLEMLDTFYRKEKKKPTAETEYCEGESCPRS